MVTTHRQQLDRRDALALKGIAISAIVLHNYFHLLPPIKENEFDFDPQRFFVFLSGLQEPAHAFQAVMSYLGHFGVQIFIFLSAYGLSKAYWDSPLSWTEFMRGRVKKIYPTFLVAIVLWIVFVLILGGPSVIPTLAADHGWAVLLTAGGIINMLPGYGLPPVGPWWFLPFIMQFYCIWPVLRAFAKRFRIVGLVLLSIACLIATGSANVYLDSRWKINLLESPLGHMPELCLGIMVARYGLRPGWLLAAVAGIVFILANRSPHLWLFSFVSVLIVSLWLYTGVRKWLSGSTVLMYLGTRAMPLFFVNGIVRMPFVTIAKDRPWEVGLLLGVVSFGFSLGIADLIRKFQNTTARLDGRGCPHEVLP